MPFLTYFCIGFFYCNFNAFSILRNRISQQSGRPVHPQFHFGGKGAVGFLWHIDLVIPILIVAEAVSVKRMISGALAERISLDLPSVLPPDPSFTMVIIF